MTFGKLVFLTTCGAPASYQQQQHAAAQDIRRPDVRNLVADMAARDRRRTLPELHHFSRQLGVPA
ncbi:hypothetical protein GCM10009601_41270 [Streptomyces thermospinosisporus]|uniref:Uncharacterized protein n=1 Tax=Streptomyces thermospinosisporus TaxID=161482 RepID=A0ABP4JTL5_9ACTN